MPTPCGVRRAAQDLDRQDPEIQAARAGQGGVSASALMGGHRARTLAERRGRLSVKPLAGRTLTGLSLAAATTMAAVTSVSAMPAVTSMTAMPVAAMIAVTAMPYVQVEVVAAMAVAVAPAA